MLSARTFLDVEERSFESDVTHQWRVTEGERKAEVKLKMYLCDHVPRSCLPKSEAVVAKADQSTHQGSFLFMVIIKHSIIT